MDHHPTWDRLEDQLAWYDGKSGTAQQAYKRTKVAQLVLAAATTVVAALSAPGWISAAFAGLILVTEGVQQLYQWQTNWVLYRSTAESLKHEKYLYLAHAGPYAGSDPLLVLAERVEGIVSQEHAKWTDARSSSEGRPSSDVPAGSESTAALGGPRDEPDG